MSESVTQLAQVDAKTSDASRVIDRQPADPAGSTPSECENQPAGSIHVFLRLGRAESRSQITWHLGSAFFSCSAPVSVTIV